MKRYTLTILLILLINAALSAQITRTQGMGGLTYSIIDEDFSLSLFDLGGNPAWLVKDETQNWLKIIPSGKSTWGDYRRRYDPAESDFYSVIFKGVKTLGEDGTFLGETSYEYDQRNNVSRSLKYNTYGGEAFFMNDTTLGDFRYTGPSMKFTYSFEPLSDFYFGASAGYKILDGLKSTYSRAQTLYRVVSGDVGLAYRIADNLTAGFTVGLLDEQEKIEAKSEDLLDVEIYNFKGETFSTRKRASSVDQKIRKESKSLGVQFYFNPSYNTEIGVAGNFSKCGEKILIPYYKASTNESFKEFEDGFASFNNYDVVLQARYYLTDGMIIALNTGYEERKSWSKNSPLELLLWEWDVKNIFVGVGSSVHITPELLIGFEYEFSSISGDSSKYVDSRYSSLESNNHHLKIGTELLVFQNVYIRAGYNISLVEKDLIAGGSDVKFNRVSLGTGLKIFDSFTIDAGLEYFNYTSDENSSITRSVISGVVSAKLFTF